MSKEILLNIGVVLFVVVLGNILIHKYFKKQQQKILKLINEYEYYHKSDLEIEFFSAPWMNFYRGDLIVCDDMVILLLNNHSFGKFLNQAQPSIYFSLDENNSKHKALLAKKKFVLHDIEIKENALIINGKQFNQLVSTRNMNIEISLDYSSSVEIFPIIEKYLTKS